MKTMNRITLTLCITLMMLVIVGAVNVLAQEDDRTFTDADGTFSVPLPPEDWTNESTENVAHYINPAGSFDLYVLALHSDDLESGMIAAREQIFGDVEVANVQSSPVTLPNGQEWQQDIFIAQLDGETSLIAVIGTYVIDTTYAMVAKGTQASFGASTNVLNGVLLNFEIFAAAPPEYVAPDYVDTSAFTEEEIVVATGDIALGGTLTLPQGDAPVPAVVLVHGSGPSDRDEAVFQNMPFKDIAWGLASQGVAVIRYDKRTFVYKESQEGFTLYDETVDDAVSAAELLANDPRIDPEQIYVLGHSLGGYAAPRIADASADVAGLIMMGAPARNLLDSMTEQYNFLATLPANQGVAGQEAINAILDEIEVARALTEASPADEFVLNAPVSYWLDLQNYDAVELAQTLDVPMLFLHAGNDYQVTETDLAIWQDALGDRENVIFREYDGLYHLFMEGPRDSAAYMTPGHVDEQVISDVAEWVKSQE